MDKRTKNAHSPDMWDYRRAKLLLDILAMEADYVERWEAIKHLAGLWGLKIVLNDEGFAPDYNRTIQQLAKYVLQHGREEVKKRKGES